MNSDSLIGFGPVGTNGPSTPPAAASEAAPDMRARNLLADEMQHHYTITADRLRDPSWPDDRFPLSTQAAIQTIERTLTVLHNMQVQRDEIEAKYEAARAMLAPPVAQQGGGEGQKCPDCKGSGDYCLGGHSAHPDNWRKCESCKGSGKLATPTPATGSGGEVSGPFMDEGSTAQASDSHGNAPPESLNNPAPAGGDAGDSERLDYIERTFSGMTNRERYLPVQMIWGKGAMGRTLREACDKYMARDRDLTAKPGAEGVK